MTIAELNKYITPDNGLYHPTDETQIIKIIEYVSSNKLQVRVRGAAQSVPAAVFTDGYPSSSDTANINIELDQMRTVTFADTEMQVTVGAGCNLGWDPYDPSQTSQQDNSNNLFYQLNQKGWAIPNVPDAIHQTVGGFISTGSSGGSMLHSFDECIVAIRMIDGNGNAKTFSKSTDPNDPFYAIGVSMGLMGIIVSVTLQCIPAFNITGQEAVTNDTQCAFDFFGNGSATQDSLQTYLTNTEFTRLLWWPFPTLKRMIAWQAKTISPPAPGPFHPKPYQPVFPKLLGSTFASSTVAGSGFRLIADWPNWLYDMIGNDVNNITPTPNANILQLIMDLINKKQKENPEQVIIDAIAVLAPYLYPLLVNMYFPCNTPQKPAQLFWDNWTGSLPMDRIEFDNNLFDLTYTEMWIPIEKANQVITVLNTYYQSLGISKVSYYTVEILAAKKSQFWMSPAYNQDVIRINIMHFEQNTASDLRYYQPFWDLMKNHSLDFRLHWGKYLPPPTSSEGSTYLSTQYAKWNDFLALRKQMDPNNIFLSAYWKAQLGITN